MALLPPPDIGAAYVDEEKRPSKDFYNWIKSLYDVMRGLIAGAGAFGSFYEAGSFTPDLRLGGGNTGMTYDTQVGNYVRMGKVVHVDINIVVNTIGSSTGDATVDGLPFTSNADSTALLVPDFLNLNSGPNILSCYFAVIFSSAGEVVLYFNDDSGGGGGSQPLTEVHLTDGSYVFLSGTYIAG